MLIVTSVSSKASSHLQVGFYLWSVLYIICLAMIIQDVIYSCSSFETDGQICTVLQQRSKTMMNDHSVQIHTTADALPLTSRSTSQRWEMYRVKVKRTDISLNTKQPSTEDGLYHMSALQNSILGPVKYVFKQA